MLLVPWAWNLIPGATCQTSDRAFTLGHGVANLTTDDPMQLCEFRGMFRVLTTSGLRFDKSDFNDGSAKTASLNAGTYYSPVEFAIEVERAHNAAGSGFVFTWTQAASGYGYFKIAHAGVSFQISSGANTARNVLSGMMGFPNADQASAASHTSPMVATSGAIAETGDRVSYDLGSAVTVPLSMVFGGRRSPGAYVLLGRGTTETSHTYWHHGDAPEDSGGVMIAYPGAYATSLRYISLAIVDPKRWEGGRASVGGWYAGPCIDTDEAHVVDRWGFEHESFTRSLLYKAAPVRGVDGSVHVSEVRPGERFGMSIQSNPGLGPAELPAFEALCRELGQHRLLGVCVDPRAQAKNRNSILARFTRPPSIQKRAVQSPHGRWSMPLELERVETAA